MKGSGNSYDFGVRIYDSRLGRWMSRDPLENFFPAFSPYNFALDNPLIFIDEGGEIPWPVFLNYKSWTRRIDSKFGWRTSTKSNHRGVDINFSGGGNTDLGAPVLATHDAVIKEVQTYDQHGNSKGTYVILEAPDGTFQTVYMHMNGIADGIENGKTVKEGQIIGYIGGSGFGNKGPKQSKKDKSHVAHLHYEIRKPNENGFFKSINPLGEDGNLVDPQLWLNMLPEFEVVEELTPQQRRKLRREEVKASWQKLKNNWKEVKQIFKNNKPNKRRGKAKF